MFEISLVKSTQRTRNEGEVEGCRQDFFVDFVYFVIVFLCAVLILLSMKQPARISNLI